MKQIPPSLRTSWLRRAGVALASVLAVWALAWWFLPGVIQHQLEQRGSALLGRRLTVGAVDFKPWSLELTLHQLAIASADGSKPQFTVERVYVDAELQSVLRMAPVIDAVTLEAPHLRLEHLGQGHYDVDDLLARFLTPDASPSDQTPPRFSLHNLELRDGSVDFADHQRTGLRQHAVRKIALAIPFLSNFDAQREVVVQPRLAFELNGGQFDTALQATPFAPARKGALSVRIQALDLAPYLPYLPPSLPVRLTSGTLDTDVQLAFVEQPSPSLAVRGTVSLSGVRVADGAGQPVLALQRSTVNIEEALPLERRVHLKSWEVVQPVVDLRRDRAGHLALLGGSAPLSGASASDVAQTPSSAWQITLDALNLQQGRLQWTDASIQARAQVALADLDVQARAVHWPLVAEPATVDASGRVDVGRKASTSGQSTGRWTISGRASDAAAQARVQLDSLGLDVAAPYLAQWLVPALSGRASVDATVQWSPKATSLEVQRLTLNDVALAEATTSSRDLPPQWKSLELSGARVDLARRSVKVDRVLLQSARLGVQRDAQGAWMFESWLTPAARANTSPAPAASTSATESAWSVAVADLAVRDGGLSLRDRGAGRRVNLAVSDLQIQAKSLTLDGAQPAQLAVSAHLKSGQTEPGVLRYNGSVGWAPVQLQGTFDLSEVPVHALVPYVADQLNIEVVRADATAKGSVRLRMAPQGPDMQLHVDAAVEDFRANSLASGATQGLAVGEELLNWKSLNVPGIDLEMHPGQATRLQVREAVLSDFFARVVVDPQGQLNLQHLVKPAPVGQGNPQASASAAAPQETPQPAPIITVGPIRLVHGRVPFSDRFIQPHYSADLSELTGKLSQFSSQTINGVVQLADLELHGRAEGSATLDITGQLNPLAHPLALNIQGRVRDLELPPLSPYAIKYAGYGIERGKLNVDVSYVVQPDGQLSASNKLVLHQLAFGDKVEGAPNSLPVKLAVALLADSRGVIDLDLPISGSINDPQFSVGPVVWKALTNLIAKALTSPFSLLAKAFGGSDALSSIPFAPGSAGLGADARRGLDQIAQALQDKPALSMTVLGAAHAQAEMDALRRERLQALVLAEKRRRAAVAAQDAAEVQVVTAAEYPVLLKEVYKRADIRKPRNMLGLVKDLPVPEMESLLLASMTVTEDAMRELALQRGIAVRDYLASHHIPSQRLYLGATRLVTTPDWSPQAELTLSDK